MQTSISCQSPSNTLRRALEVSTNALTYSPTDDPPSTAPIKSFVPSTSTAPSDEPSISLVPSVSAVPSSVPTASKAPTDSPTDAPTHSPSSVPGGISSVDPLVDPSDSPCKDPSKQAKNPTAPSDTGCQNSLDFCSDGDATKTCDAYVDVKPVKRRRGRRRGRRRRILGGLAALPSGTSSEELNDGILYATTEILGIEEDGTRTLQSSSLFNNNRRDLQSSNQDCIVDVFVVGTTSCINIFPNIEDKLEDETTCYEWKISIIDNGGSCNVDDAIESVVNNISDDKYTDALNFVVVLKPTHFYQQHHQEIHPQK
jgi:hypothetical protein